MPYTPYGFKDMDTGYQNLDMNLSQRQMPTQQPQQSLADIFNQSFYKKPEQQGNQLSKDDLMILATLLGRGQGQQNQQMPYNQEMPSQTEYGLKFTPEAGRPNPFVQPVAGGKGNFGKNSSLQELIRKQESGGNYKIRNKQGFVGAYQFGAPALEAIGYLKKGAGKSGNSALNDEKNWNFPGGVQAFLNSKELQDKAYDKLTSMHLAELKKKGVINKNTDPRKINAMLAAAHISGPGGVIALMRGKNRKDVTGGSAQAHYNIGLKARI